jgi:hypothetical protein
MDFVFEVGALLDLTVSGRARVRGAHAVLREERNSRRSYRLGEAAPAASHRAGRFSPQRSRSLWFAWDQRQPRRDTRRACRKSCSSCWLLRSLLATQRIPQRSSRGSRSGREPLAQPLRRRPRQRRASHSYGRRIRGSTWFPLEWNVHGGSHTYSGSPPGCPGDSRAASHDAASLALRPIRATRSMAPLKHRPSSTPFLLHALRGLSRLSYQQSH